MLALLISVSTALSVPTWEMVESGVTTSIRGLDAVDSKTCWLGTKGGVARTTDAGKSWQFFKIGADADELDFRDIEAFDALSCIAMSAGSGEASRIYRTENGGETWKLAHQNKDAAGFFNGIAFRDAKHGILAGDPIGGRLFLLATDDAGASWHRVAKDSSPEMGKGEHAFAASGTHLTVNKSGHVWVTSGGKVARVFRSEDWGEKWDEIATPMIAGLPSTGTFSIAFSPAGARTGIAVGGDYEKESEGKDNAMRTADGGKTWRLVRTEDGAAPFHFRSCIGYVDGKTLVAVGPSGSDITRDGGATWQALHGEHGFHTLSIAGGMAWAAGAEGRVGRLKL